MKYRLTSGAFEASEKENRILSLPERMAGIGAEEQFFIRIYGHAANFIFFRGPKGLAQRMKSYGILIRDCSNFPGLEEGWYRIAVRPRRENEHLLKALEEIRNSI